MAEQTIRGYHLSRQQKRIWQFHQSGTAFVVQAALLLTGRLDRERLQRSIARVVDRHEILRTAFRQPSGLKLPIQVVADETESIWREIHVSVGEAGLPEVVETLLRRDREPLFDADRSPLRFTLGVVDESRHVLLVTASALVADVESLYLAAEDAMRIYSGAGRDSGDEEPLQYAAFGAWQAEMLDNEEATLGRKYWRSQDVAPLCAIEHPLMRRRPDEGDLRVERVARAIDPDLASAIDDLARQMAKTDQQVYLSCWGALLARLTGRT